MSIEMTGIVKRFRATTALAGVELETGPGIFGLLGPNGAGKTTLMRIITTLLKPDAGSALILGHDLTREPRAIRQRLGYLPQEFGLFKSLTAHQTLEYVASLKGLKQPQKEIKAVLDKVGLLDRAKDKVGGFSGGMKRRIGIAQAILGNPDLLVVDEPTAGLDPEERIRFRNLLVELAAERTVLLSTHIVGDIEASCNRLAVLCQGRVVFSGKASELGQIASGQVWEVSGPVPANCKLLSTRRQEDDIISRVLCPDNPGGTELSSTLEDGYMILMEQERASNGQAV